MRLGSSCCIRCWALEPRDRLRAVEAKFALSSLATSDSTVEEVATTTSSRADLTFDLVHFTSARKQNSEYEEFMLIEKKRRVIVTYQEKSSHS